MKYDDDGTRMRGDVDHRWAVRVVGRGSKTFLNFQQFTLKAFSAQMTHSTRRLPGPGSGPGSGAGQGDDDLTPLFRCQTTGSC